MTAGSGDKGGPHLPDWVPEEARRYLAHTAQGQPIRALARAAQVHPSTILRQVRRFEGRRDDPLVDAALHALSAGLTPDQPSTEARLPPDDARLTAETDRILRRLAEPQTILAVGRDMDMAVVVRDGGDGQPQRLATVSASVAQAMALRGWIACAEPTARIARYAITGEGRALLRSQAATGLAEAQARFAGAGPDDRLRHMRSLLGDSPLSALARRRDKDGRAFLDRALVVAGERLREDFELAQMGPRVAQDWDQFLVGRPSAAPGDGRGDAAAAARARVDRALADLGPGLADVALRVCCLLEGLEALERRMDWSARSGKVVLRIALQRLARHYAETYGTGGPMIG